MVSVPREPTRKMLAAAREVNGIFPTWCAMVAAAPASQPHPEPIAWMVGTAIWWTKEEAERDSAATGLPMIGLRPMSGIEPDEQHQGEPVAWMAKTLRGSLAGTLGLARRDARLNPDLYEGPFPVFRHADPGEVERIENERAEQWRLRRDAEADRDTKAAVIAELRAQLAKH
ncbi:hypothetical protein [Pseudomonas sp. NGC7]|uniref:hypothetical protein n=1 Tax=Pseudomonas sp. NGC7 TaxID=3341775 RepID=UPI0037DB3196